MKGDYLRIASSEGNYDPANKQLFADDLRCFFTFSSRGI